MEGDKKDSLRKGDGSKEFQEALKNPPKPINKTEVSPEYEEYLKNLDDGNLGKKPENLKNVEVKGKNIPICPTCRRKSLKITPQKIYCCGFCGLQTNSPSYIFERE